MKKILCIILTLIMISILSSCAHRKSPNTAPSDTEDVMEENTLTSPESSNNPETSEKPPKVTEELPPVNDERLCTHKLDTIDLEHLIRHFLTKMPPSPVVEGGNRRLTDEVFQANAYI